MFDSKQLRKEKQIIIALMKKFQNAFLIEYNPTKETDTFTIDKKFKIVRERDGTLNVFNLHTNEQIISIQHNHDTDSQKRQKLLQNFIIFARTQSRKFSIKQEQAEKQRKAQEAIKQMQIQRANHIKKLNDALTKLK